MVGIRDLGQTEVDTIFAGMITGAFGTEETALRFAPGTARIVGIIITPATLDKSAAQGKRTEISEEVQETCVTVVDDEFQPDVLAGTSVKAVALAAARKVVRDAKAQNNIGNEISTHKARDTSIKAAEAAAKHHVPLSNSMASKIEGKNPHGKGGGHIR